MMVAGLRGARAVPLDLDPADLDQRGLLLPGTLAEHEDDDHDQQATNAGGGHERALLVVDLTAHALLQRLEAPLEVVAVIGVWAAGSGVLAITSLPCRVCPG